MRWAVRVRRRQPTLMASCFTSPTKSLSVSGKLWELLKPCFGGVDSDQGAATRLARVEAATGNLGIGVGASYPVQAAEVGDRQRSRRVEVDHCCGAGAAGSAVRVIERRHVSAIQLQSSGCGYRCLGALTTLAVAA